MRLLILCAIAFLNVLSLSAEESATVRAADGFQLPVGPNGTGEGYYIARGYRPNGHLGEDWNGVHGGDTDLGDPVYATANGFVTFARNYHVGWGNVVILRHAYYEGSELKYVDSLYGHLLDFSVQEGEQVHRGQQIGRIGNNFGMYEAHLHFEMRKNLEIGMFRSSFARDFTNYYTPNEFVAAHHACPKGNHMVKIPVNTYPPAAPPVLAGPHVETPVFGPPPAGAPAKFAKVAPLPPSPAAPTPTPSPTPVFRTAKTATPAPTATPEALAKKTAKSQEVAAAPAATPTPAPLAKPAKPSSGDAPVVVTLATPEPSGKHGKQLATAATPDPTPKKFMPVREMEDAPAASSAPAPTIAFKTASTDAPVVAPPTTPVPIGKHGKHLAAAPAPDPTPMKFAPVQEVADAPATPPTAAPTIAFKTAVPDGPVVAPPATPAPAGKRGKHLAAAATPDPLPKKAAKPPEVADAPINLPVTEDTEKLAKEIADASLPMPNSDSSAKNLALIPEPIAAAVATPFPTRKLRKPSGTPAKDSAAAEKFANQTIPPEPILPTPTGDAVPMRQTGSTFKVDRFGDLRGKSGF